MTDTPDAHHVEFGQEGNIYEEFAFDESPVELTLEELTCCHRLKWCGLVGEFLLTDIVFKCCCLTFTVSNLFWLVTVLILLALAYTILLFAVGESMLPGGDLFGLVVVVTFAYFLGWSLAYVPYLHVPPVFGMLLAGIIVRNTDMYDITTSMGINIIATIRAFAVTFVMLRAGLQLHTTALRENPIFILNLAILPCTLEMLLVTLSSNTLLGYPWPWAFLAGTVIACISPVVPINCILALAERGYGVDKDIDTLLFGAASIDDLHIVSCYTICYAFLFESEKLETNWWYYIYGGLRVLLAGVTVGAVLGILFIFFPHRSHVRLLQKYVMWYRMTALVLGSLLCTIGAARLELYGGGFLAVITMGLFATTGWRILTDGFDVTPMRRIVHVMWHFTQPLLVGSIGATIDFSDWDLERTGLYTAVLFIGLSVRTIFAFLSTFHAPFTTRERVFVALSWISKGTIQAALAPAALKEAVDSGREEDIEVAKDLVKISIMSVLVLAPLGAALMMLTGPYLLTKTTEPAYEKRRRVSLLKLMSLQSTQVQQRRPRMSRTF